jgi:hypothetical protein
LNNKDKKTEEISIIDEEAEVHILEGNLIISDFPNLKEINLYEFDAIHNIPHLEIKNCSNLKTIVIAQSKMKEFITDYLPNLVHLDLHRNNLTSLDISKYPKLTMLLCERNDNLQPPLQTLTQKIQQKEKELSSLREREQQEKITNLEQELQSLKDLKIRLETQAQQKETELNHGIKSN